MAGSPSGMTFPRGDVCLERLPSLLHDEGDAGPGEPWIWLGA